MPIVTKVASKMDEHKNSSEEWRWLDLMSAVEVECILSRLVETRRLWVSLSGVRVRPVTSIRGGQIDLELDLMEALAAIEESE